MVSLHTRTGALFATKSHRLAIDRIIKFNPLRVCRVCSKLRPTREAHPMGFPVLKVVLRLASDP